MIKIIDYKTLYNEFLDLTKKADVALIRCLNDRNIDSINVKPYMDEDLIDWYCFPQTDKNGYGVNVKINTLRKTDKGWVADVVDEDDEDWDTLEVSRNNFDVSGIIDILGIVESIFAVADEDYNGKVLAADEDFDDIKS
jgi:hypothetical protein